ncbi:MAG: glycosyltransferase family 2 protein [Alphaproteobacteria bacterium]|nr:glycosyltransferase family 2 protein [Alphaproteobacteria bacterium]
MIVNYNTGALLAQVVQSVFEQTLQPAECIVVDNGSSDTSIPQLREAISDPRLRVIELGTNVGFAAGSNHGISESTGSHVLLLNPDCFLDAGALRALVDEFGADPEIGAVGPLILNMDGSEQRGCRRDIPTPWQIFCVGLGLHLLMPDHPRFRGFNQSGDEVPGAPVQVQSVSGACLLIRRDVLENVGFLDERYFLHFEDLDWCLRAGKAGWTIHFVPGAIAHHVGGVSGRNRPYRVEAHKHASLIRFVRTNFASYYPSAFIAFVSLIVYARWLTVVGRMALLGRSRARKGWYNLFVGSED